MAGPADREPLVSWFDAFQGEVHVGARQDSDAAVADQVSFGGLRVWQGEATVSMAGVTRPAAGTVRVAPVHTPPGHRGHGYAAVVTAAILQAALDAGAGDVVLFTDTDNPTGNALYARLGFRPVEDRTVLEFT